jgi:uncharacterized protein (TIGR02996 family)
MADTTGKGAATREAGRGERVGEKAGVEEAQRAHGRGRAATIDLSAARAAIAASDATGFTAGIAELGLALELDALVAYAHSRDARHPGMIAALLDVAATALREPTGYGLVETRAKRKLLAVRLGDHLVLGLEASSGWKLGRWYKDPARNRRAVEAWAADPAREADALRLTITRQPAPLASPSDARGEDLLARIIAEPDDLAAVLVYGDWLAEQGDVRGELIRVQCELEREDLDDDRHVALVARERELLVHRGALLAPIAAFVESATLRRGLIDGVTIRAGQLAKHGAALLERHPIRRLEVIVDGPAELARLATLPFLARVPELAIEGASKRTGRAVVEPSATLASPLWATVRSLSLGRLGDPDTEWARCFASLVAPALERLDLAGLGCTPGTLARLADASRLPSLRRLAIGSPTYAVGDPAYLSRDAALVDAVGELVRGTLIGLGFHSMLIGDASLAACVTAAAASPTLRELGLHRCAIASETLQALAGAVQLERLEVSDHKLDLAAFAATLRELPALREIVLEGLVGHPDDLELVTQALAEAPALERVVWHGHHLPDDQRARLRGRLVRARPVAVARASR